MADRFVNFADAPNLPAGQTFAVAPHDTNALPDVPKALFVGTGGTIVLRSASGQADVTFKNVASGQILPVRASHVRAAGTTAADIVALA